MKYRLLPKYQRRADGGPRSYPIAGIVFCGADVVETDRNLSKWVGLLIVAVVDAPSVKAAVPTPAPVPAPAPAPAPEPVPEPAPVVEPPKSVDEKVVVDTPAPESVVKPAAKKRVRRSRKKANQ